MRKNVLLERTSNFSLLLHSERDSIERYILYLNVCLRNSATFARKGALATLVSFVTIRLPPPPPSLSATMAKAIGEIAKKGRRGWEKEGRKRIFGSWNTGKLAENEVMDFCTNYVALALWAQKTLINNYFSNLAKTCIVCWKFLFRPNRIKWKET